MISLYFRLFLELANTKKAQSAFSGTLSCSTSLKGLGSRGLPQIAALPSARAVAFIDQPRIALS